MRIPSAPTVESELSKALSAASAGIPDRTAPGVCAFNADRNRPAAEGDQLAERILIAILLLDCVPQKIRRGAERIQEIGVSK